MLPSSAGGKIVGADLSRSLGPRLNDKFNEGAGSVSRGEEARCRISSGGARTEGLGT